MSENIMTYKGYSAAIQYSEEDGVLVGRVLGINDFIDFHGESVREVRAEFHTAINEYLKACAQLGEKPARPCSGKLLLHLPLEVHASLALAAEASGQSANQLIVDAVRARYPGEAAGRIRTKRRSAPRRRATAGTR